MLRAALGAGAFFTVERGADECVDATGAAVGRGATSGTANEVERRFVDAAVVLSFSMGLKINSLATDSK